MALCFRYWGNFTGGLDQWYVDDIHLPAVPYAPSIYASPTNRSVIQGNAADFSVVAIGNGTLNYLWYFNGSLAKSTTNSSYSLTNAQTNNSGSYYVVVTNSYGSVTSDVVTLTVLETVSITSAPTNVSVYAGSAASLSVTASGAAPLSYQWYKSGVAVTNGSTVSGAATNVLSFSAASLSDAGSYYVVVSNSVSCATSAVAVLTVNAVTAPGLSASPSSQTVNAGDSASFSVSVSGTAPFTFLWYKDGVLVSGSSSVSGASTSNLVINPVSSSDAGSYYVVVSNSSGCVTSAVAVLTVVSSGAPTIQTQPQALTVWAHSNATFSVSVTGGTPLHYQWYKGSNRISSVSTSGSSTNATLRLTNVLFSYNGGLFSVVVSNSSGVVTSSTAALTVLSAPVIGQMAASQTVVEGDTVSLQVYAYGTAPLSYFWYKDGVALTNGGRFSGVTNSTLTITDTLKTNAGTYSVVVSNVYGTATGSMVLTVDYIQVTHSCPGYQSAGTCIVNGYVRYSTHRILGMMYYTPTLPDNWTVSSVEGIGGPTLQSTLILFTNYNQLSNNNPVTFTYTISVPTGYTNTQYLQGVATCVLSNVLTNVAAQSTPLAVQYGPLLYINLTTNTDKLLTLHGDIGGYYLIESSRNFTNWTDEALLGTTNGRATVFKPGTNDYRFFRAVSCSSTAPRISIFPQDTNVSLRVVGFAGFQYIIQTSTNLGSSNWTDLATVTTTNGLADLLQNHPDFYRFFRAKY